MCRRALRWHAPSDCQCLKKSSRAPTEIRRSQPQSLLDLDMTLTCIEEAGIPGMTSTMLELSLGDPQHLNLQTTADTRWSAYLTSCLRADHLFYDSIKPNVQYSSVGQALGANNAGYEPPTNQVPSHPMDFLPRPSGAYMTPDNQEAAHIYRVRDYWVSYACQDELYVTIALKRVPFT